MWCDGEWWGGIGCGEGVGIVFRVLRVFHGLGIFGWLLIFNVFRPLLGGLDVGCGCWGGGSAVERRAEKRGAAGEWL